MIAPAKEKVIIEIDPKTLDYEATYAYTFIDDIYIVLRDMVYKMETGHIHESGTLTLQNRDGTPTSKEDFVGYITALKQKVDAEQNVNLNMAPGSYIN